MEFGTRGDVNAKMLAAAAQERLDPRVLAAQHTTGPGVVPSAPTLLQLTATVLERVEHLDGLVNGLCDAVGLSPVDVATRPEGYIDVRGVLEHVRRVLDRTTQRVETLRGTL